MFDFEPAPLLSCPTAPSRQESGSDTIEEEEDAYPTLRNMFAVTIGCKYGNEDKEILFEYGDALSPIPSTDPSGSWCSLSHPTSSCGFPGDSLVGFACGLIHAAGMLLQTQAMLFWVSSLHINFPSSIQPQQLSPPTQTLCPSELFTCDDLLAADGIHVSGVAQCPGGGILAFSPGGHIPTLLTT